MSAATAAPPSPDDRVQFLEYHRPPLRAGDYTLTVAQEVNGAPGKPGRKDEATSRFTVAGDRWALSQGLVREVFPPAGSTGPWYRVLPHLVLSRSTLPWERSPRGEGHEEALTPSWLALLVFVGDEIPTIQPIAAAALEQDQPAADGRARWQAPPPETVHDPQQPAIVIDVPWKTLQPQLPSYEDLGLCAHARRVEPAGGTLDAGTGGGGLQDPNQIFSERALVVAARLAAPGVWTPESGGLRMVPTKCAVHLVSLEHRYTVARGAKPATGPATPLLKAAWAALKPTVDGLEAVLAVKASPVTANPVNAEAAKARAAKAGAAKGDATTPKDAHAAWNRLHALEAELQIRTGAAPQLLAPIDATDAEPTDAAVMAGFVALAGGTRRGQATLPDGTRLSIRITRPTVLDERGRRVERDEAVIDMQPAPPKPVDTGKGDAAKTEAAGTSKAGAASADPAGPAERSAAKTALPPTTTPSTPPPPPPLPTALAATFDKRPAAAVRVRLREGLAPIWLAPRPLPDAQPMPAARLGALLQSVFPDGPWLDRLKSRGSVRLERWWPCAGTWRRLVVEAVQSDQMTEVTLTLRPEAMLAFDAPGAGDDTRVRLVSLHHWSFDCEPAAPPPAGQAVLGEAGTGRHFAARAAALVNKVEDARLRLRLPGLQPPEQARIDAGYVPLPHALRTGERTVSWYRGPLAPGLPPAPPEPTLPASCADALLLYDPALGLFDTSWAAAWELGRQLAVADRKFSYGLFLWKRAHRQSLLALRRRLDRQFLSIAHPLPPDTDLPDELRDWLDRLARLEGLPFGYLVPDERLLPIESLRFFAVDPGWVEALRDGALSIGRVLPSDFAAHAAHDEQLPAPPRLSGALIRSSIVKDWPSLTVRGFVRTSDSTEWETAGELAGRPGYRELLRVRQTRLAPDVLFVLFEDDPGQTEQQRELDLLELHVPPEVLHFGLEGAAPDWRKDLRDPGSGDLLTFTGPRADLAGERVLRARLSGDALRRLAELKAVAPALEPLFAARFGVDRSAPIRCSLAGKPEALQAALQEQIAAIVGRDATPDEVKAVVKLAKAAGDSLWVDHAAVTTAKINPSARLLLRIALAEAAHAGSAELQWDSRTDTESPKVPMREQLLAANPKRKADSQATQDLVDRLWVESEKTVEERVPLPGGVWRDRAGGTLDLAALFQLLADRMRPVVGDRAVTTADLALQLLDASPLVRILR